MGFSMKREKRFLFFAIPIVLLITWLVLSFITESQRRAVTVKEEKGNW